MCENEANNIFIQIYVDHYPKICKVVLCEEFSDAKCEILWLKFKRFSLPTKYIIYVIYIYIRLCMKTPIITVNSILYMINQNFFCVEMFFVWKQGCYLQRNHIDAIAKITPFICF